ncbi:MULTISPECIES: hypothetical protein [unclassified Sphingomonas]|uniref:hypothetical protein n=1 Tax=Novosphingobium rhizosphaerae TaxID=1551649 RepID=UPI0015C7EE82
MRSVLVAAAGLALSTTPALAATDPEAPVFENGTVWEYSEIATTDGHFDDYLQWLDTEWKAQEEALKKAGVIKSYKVLLVGAPRKGEGDVILAVEYANMAAFDRSVADGYALQKKIFGSIAQANQGQASRASIRTILSTTLLREAVLK